MNTVYLTQAEPLLRGAHAATIKQEDRDKVRKMHAELLAFLRSQGIFYGEIQEDKTGKTSAPSKTVGDMSLASSIRRAADRQANPIMDEDDTRLALAKLCQEQQDRLLTLQSENESWRVDSQMLSDIHDLLDAAMPGFKGVPSTPEWTIAAVRELIQLRDSLIAALKDTLAPLQDAQNQLHHLKAAAAFINAREIIRHCENQSAEKNTLRGQS